MALTDTVGRVRRFLLMMTHESLVLLRLIVDAPSRTTRPVHPR